MDSLDLFWIRCYEEGASLRVRQSDAGVEEQDAVFIALRQLHARSCRVASEIAALLRTGHAEGAMARWRTLHEISVTMAFIRRHGDEMARRYLDHAQARNANAMVEYDKHAARLGGEPFSTADHQNAVAVRDELVQRYGEVFVAEYGWASSAFPVTRKGQPARPTFAQIEESVGMDHHRPWYRLASHGQHAGASALLRPLPMSDGDEESLLLAGASDMGLVEPGTGAISSLLQATTTFLMVRTDLRSVSAAKALLTLADSAIAGFERAYDSIDYCTGNQTVAKQRFSQA